MIESAAQQLNLTGSEGAERGVGRNSALGVLSSAPKDATEGHRSDPDDAADAGGDDGADADTAIGGDSAGDGGADAGGDAGDDGADADDAADSTSDDGGANDGADDDADDGADAGGDAGDGADDDDDAGDDGDGGANDGAAGGAAMPAGGRRGGCRCRLGRRRRGRCGGHRLLPKRKTRRDERREGIPRRGVPLLARPRQELGGDCPRALERALGRFFTKETREHVTRLLRVDLLPGHNVLGEDLEGLVRRRRRTRPSLWCDGGCGHKELLP